MFTAFSTPQNRKRSVIFLALCAVLGIAAVVVGIDDNPPGLALAFLAACALMLAFVHHLRTPRQFLLLLAGAFGVFIVSVVLHNLFEGLATYWLGSGAAANLFGGAGAGLFLLAVLVCPAAMLVGAVGALVAAIRRPSASRANPAG